MSGKNVDTEALRQAAKALGGFIAEATNSIKKLQYAAVECKENMGNDVISQKAVMHLAGCTKELTATLKHAEELQGKILARARRIDDFGNSF